MGCRISPLNSATNIIYNVCSYSKNWLCLPHQQRRGIPGPGLILYTQYLLWFLGAFPSYLLLIALCLQASISVGGHVLCTRYKYDSLCPSGTQSLAVKYDNKE